ncbi:MAG: pimeloyl-ACP methyl ester carboxylesterase [Planctomycetota bacterium]|jgi:pimeloyl-ACP methyl ester carboxylesterase
MSHLLLIHGAWGGAWEFEETLEGLRNKGHRATAIDLPGHGQFTVPIAEVTMEAYVQTVIDAAEAIEGPIVLVGHSLGGAIISQVAEKVPHKIERLVYVAAILPSNGQTPLGLMQSDEAGELLTQLEFSEDGSFVAVGPEVVKSALLNDVLEPERLAAFVPHFAMKQATEPFMFEAKLTTEAFGSIPKTYVRASIDKVLSPALQDEMMKSWKVDRVFTLKSGHFPLMSMPQELIDVLHEATGVPSLHA